jgi:hypothetical protein
MSDGFAVLFYADRQGRGHFLGSVSGDTPDVVLRDDRCPLSVGMDLPFGDTGTVELYPEPNYGGEPVIITGHTGVYDLPGAPVRSIRLRRDR